MGQYANMARKYFKISNENADDDCNDDDDVAETER